MSKSWSSRFANTTYNAYVYGLGGICLAILVLPVLIALIMSFTSGQTLKFPPPGFSLRWYEALFDPAVSYELYLAAWNTLQVGFLAMLVSLLFTVPAAFGMVRISARRANALEPLFLAPLVLPSLVYGLALLVTANLLGISASIWLVVFGHVVGFGPLMYRAVASVASQLDPSLEEASALLGASRWGTFRRIVLPLLAPGIFAGMFLVFMHSIDNVSVTIFLAPAGTTILPLRLFSMLQDALDPRIASMSGVQVAFAIIMLIVVQRLTPFLRREKKSDH